MAAISWENLIVTLQNLTPFQIAMYAIGYAGQGIFGLRFLVQWIATERRRKVVVPMAFWYLSLAGTVLLLSYAIHRRDPVLIPGFSLNMIIYLRNLYFAQMRHRRVVARVTGLSNAAKNRVEKFEK